MPIICLLYTSAQVYTTKNVETAIEDYAASQIQALCDQPLNEGCQIAVMTDVHAGIVGTIAVSYTHLDVYKRQAEITEKNCETQITSELLEAYSLWLSDGGAVTVKQFQKLSRDCLLYTSF